jgi:hypothetical protein
MSAQKKRKLDEAREEVKKAFSRHPLEKARNMLGLEKRFSLNQLGRFNIEAIQVNAEELKQHHNEISRVQLNDDLDGWNEATARNFVHRVLCSVNNVIRPRYNTRVGNETAVNSRENHGKADLTIKIGKIILLAVEVKTTNIEVAVAQNLLQLAAVREQNLEMGADLGDTMFGVATTGDQWVMVKVVFGAEKPIASITKIMPLSIKRKRLFEKNSFGQLELLHGQITPLTMEQTEKLKLAIKSTSINII